jgi:hypothetical protein
MILVSACFIISGCSDDGAFRAEYQANPLLESNARDIVPGDEAFAIAPKYSSIRSYPGGGGVFIARLLTGDGYTGSVNLSLRAHPLLNARLDRDVLDNRSRIAEITIRPDQSIDIGIYEIELLAARDNDPSNTGRQSAVLLNVELLQWGPGNIDDAVLKKDEFIGWLKNEHPELGDFSNRVWFPYMTYPQIWIVEHWTFLDKEWEFRLCYHVMIPPYDWSMIMLRQRGRWNPVLAAMRESDGTIHEIPVSEYPIMFGY